MLFKILGSIVVILASTALGYALSREFSKRPQEIRILQAHLQMLENEIVFMSSLLTDAFEKIYKSGNSAVNGFFGKTAEYLVKNTNLNALEAWEMSVRNNIKNTALNKEDEEILLSFGKMLGNSDRDGQVNNIRLTLAQLKLQEQKAEENRKKNEMMYKRLGILGGIAIVIILI